MPDLTIVKVSHPMLRCDKRIGIALSIATISTLEFSHTHYVACLHKEMNTPLAPKEEASNDDILFLRLLLLWQTVD